MKFILEKKSWMWRVVCSASVALGSLWCFPFSVYDFSLEAGSGVKLPVGWLACVSLVVDVGVQLPLVDGHIRGLSGLPIDLTYPCLL